jgi:Ni,Fe-hydrogenase III large subunit
MTLRLDLATAAIPSLEPPAWATEVRARLALDHRLVTLYGRPDPAGVVVTAVLAAAPRELSLLRTTVDPAHGFHAITEAFTAAHCFERELHEQHGVRIAGHPWLKPIRFEHVAHEAMNQYPFWRLEGKEVHEVNVGPIHAGVIEPGAFRFMCLGEIVHHLEIHLGYQHRGVEKLLLARDARTLAPLVETIAGDSSIAHTWAYAAALEALAGGPDEAAHEVARGLLLELERVGMHLSGLAGMATDIGFLQGAAGYGRLRTIAINATMRLCGSRFGRGAIRPCSARVRVDQELRPALAELARDVAVVNDCFVSARTVQHRLRDVGTVSTAKALELGLVGPSARASGVALDLRTHIPITVEPTGDCWARARVRMGEIDRSLAWIAEALPRLSPPPALPAPERLAPARLVVSLVEGWRGEVVHCLETDAGGVLRHYKVQDPSLRNWLGLAMAVRGNEISDFPICNKSFDLSYCGNDL